jgi:hypothetical protein
MQCSKTGSSASPAGNGVLNTDEKCIRFDMQTDLDQPLRLIYIPKDIQFRVCSKNPAEESSRVRAGNSPLQERPPQEFALPISLRERRHC